MSGVLAVVLCRLFVTCAGITVGIPDDTLTYFLLDVTWSSLGRRVYGKTKEQNRIEYDRV